MTWLRGFFLRLIALFRRGQLEQELDEELRSHLEMQVEENSRKGMSPREARYAALRSFGGVEHVKEIYREKRGLPVIETLVQDLRYGARTLRKTPVFTLVVVASLALGIGANTAVFAIIHAAMLRMLPVPHPEELVQLQNVTEPVLSFPMYRDLRARQQVFTDIVATTREWQVRLTIPSPVDSAVIDNVPTSFVTGNYFSVLGVQPQIGRFFTGEEDQVPESAEMQGSVAVLSDGFWERQFGRDPAVLDRVIHVNRSPCRVVGVAPHGFAGEIVGQFTDVWVPLVSFSPRRYLENRRGMFTRYVARLKSEVSQEQGQSAMTVLFQHLVQLQWSQYPETRPKKPRPVRDYAIRLVPAATGLDSGLRGTFSKPLWVIMGIVAIVLLIACANVANLLVARSTWRRREFSLRLALGCSRGRLIRQLLTESVLLASMGALAGLLLSYWGSRALLLMAGAGPLDLGPNATVLAFVIAVAVLTGIGFGVAPAMRASRVDLSLDLSQQGRSGAGRHVRRQLSRTLVMTQVALSLVLLTGAGLLMRSIRNLRQVDLGFQPGRVLIFDVAHDPQSQEPAALARVARQVHERVRLVPGVGSASLSRIQLFSDSDLYHSLRIRDNPGGLDEPVSARFNSVSAGYLETVGMTILEGRSIQEQDTGNAPPVAVINESMARKYFPRGSPLGRMMEIIGRPASVVGVVRDAKYNDLRAAVKPMFYIPIQQFPMTVRAIEVRTTQPASTITPLVRRAVLEATPDLMIRRVTSLSGQIDLTLRAERLIASLCVAFGVIALLLASVGLYGVISYEVAQRTAEIGIRMALGATRGGVLWLILRQSVVVVAAGVIFGVALALATTRLITSFLYGLTPTDVSTIAGAGAVLLCVAAIAAYLPARRASRVDPMVALRYE
jgi:predicted permease